MSPPRLGLPGTVAREFLLVVEPPDQTVRAGDPAEVVLNSFGREDFNDPIDLRISEWSTQRFPDPKPGSTLPLAASFPGTINPGDKVTVHFETAGADGGIYFITIEGSGGGMTKAVDIALVLR